MCCVSGAFAHSQRTRRNPVWGTGNNAFQVPIYRLCFSSTNFPNALVSASNSRVVTCPHMWSVYGTSKVSRDLSQFLISVLKKGEIKTAHLLRWLSFSSTLVN